MQWFKDHVESEDSKATKPSAVRRTSEPLKLNGSLANGVNGRTSSVRVNVSQMVHLISGLGADCFLQIPKDAVPKKKRKAPFARFTAYISAFLGL